MRSFARPSRSADRGELEQARAAALRAETEGAQGDVARFVDHRPLASAQRRMEGLIAQSAPVRRLTHWSAVAQLKHTAEKYEGKYDGNEIREMLDASQGRAGSTGAAGHVREHVQDAAGTRDYAKNEKKMKTCFVNDSQQNKAVVSALNTSTGQAELKKFDAGASAPERVIISNVAIDQVNAWQSKWDPDKQDSTKAKQIHATQATVIVDRLATLARPEIHVQTAYPLDG